MFAKPQEEHEWLSQFVGEWDLHHDCAMPDGSESTADGVLKCRTLGGMWLICESSGQSPEGEAWSSIMTIGFDTAKGHFVGTFVGSMMANVWAYEGQLDAQRKRLPLHTVGPKFDGSGSCNYRDTIEVVDRDQWKQGSEIQNEDGTWVQFMDGTHTRR